MKLLENESNFFGAVADHVVFAKFRKIYAIHDDTARIELIESAKNVDKGGLARAGRAHERDPFGSPNVETEPIESAQRAIFLDKVLDRDLRRRRLLLGQNLDRSAHASPRKIEAGRMLASRRSGYALRMATIIVRATATGYTISRGRAATPNTCLPSQIERKMPAAAPIRPPAKPSNAASARKRRKTRRVAPPMAFIRPTSFLRSIATLVIATITQSAVSTRTVPIVKFRTPEIRP